MFRQKGREADMANKMNSNDMKELIEEFNDGLNSFKGMTIDHLGDMATEADLKYFRSACEAYQSRTGCSDIEATDYIWGRGGWLQRAYEETGKELDYWDREQWPECEVDEIAKAKGE